MAVKTQAQLLAQVASLLADNTTGDISANDVRTCLNDIIDSANYGGSKVYKALLNQTGTNAPVATVLVNTLSGTPVWSRSGIGQYRLTLAGEFLQYKVFVGGFMVDIGTAGLPPITKNYIQFDGGGYFYTIYRVDDDTLAFDIVDNALAFVDDLSGIKPSDARFSLPTIEIFP